MLDTNWEQLTPEQKKTTRFNWLLNPENITFVNETAAKAYRIRAQRIIDVFNVKEPDQVPVALPVSSLPAYMYGLSYKTATYDYDKATQAYLSFNNKYAEEIDQFITPEMIIPAKAYDLLDFKLYSWPGHGLSEQSSGIQFVESEYMKADEYDVLVKDPSDFWLRRYLPRTFGNFESFKTLAALTSMVEVPTPQLMPLASPQVQDTLQRLLEAGKELANWSQYIENLSRRGIEMGFPIIPQAFAKAPFDILGDTLRGTQGIMKDMYRQPDKLLAAMDRIADLAISSAIESANALKAFKVFMPLHKGADGWMSQKQFDTFYWPPLKKVVNALIEEGLLVFCFAEGSYNTRLEKINEFPKGSVCWSFDQTDIFKAKQILGSDCAIQGNVPASLMITGKPAEIKEHCRKLIEVCGKGGGYILSSGASDIDEAGIENLIAMVQAAKEYGVY